MAAGRVGLYPGTFDPVTLGHADIIRRSLALVDRLVIGVAVNQDKGPLFSLDERVSLLRQSRADWAPDAVERIEVRPFDTLLVRFAEEIGASVVIRGLRAVADFEYEYQMVGMNRVLSGGIEHVFLMADAQHQAIASKLVKEVARLGGDVGEFVSPAICERLYARLAEDRARAGAWPSRA